MTKSTITILAIVAFLVISIGGFFMWANGVYNKGIAYQEQVNASWGDVLATYQRRADLIPNLVSTVKGAAENEKSILLGVTQARAGLGNAKTPAQVEAYAQKINTAINVVFEKYPEVKSTQNFAELQAQLEGTENRINVSRQKYNDVVKDYNIHIRGFFRKMALNVFGDANEFPRKEAFQASAGAENAPKVQF